MPARTAKKSKHPQYDVHPAISMVQKWVGDLKAKTGRSLDEWMKHIKKSGPAGEAARSEWLKKEHGFGTNSAGWLAERAAGRGGGEDEDPQKYLQAAVKYVDALYAGPKAELRSMHDALVSLGRSLGKDVRVCPCQTMVPLFRRYVFAQIKPSTRTRIDLGLALGKFTGKLPRRLIDTGGKEKKDRITHRIEIATPSDIDAEVKKWLKTAYALDV